MHSRILTIVFVLALPVACADTRGPDDEPAQRVSGNIVDPASRDRPGGACDDDQAAAERLLAESQSCSSDDQCTTAQIEGPCLLPFLCQVAIQRDADLEHVQSEAARLSADFRACSESCTIASCVFSERAPAFCDPNTKRCRVTTQIPRP